MFSLRAAGALSASMLYVMPPAEGGLAAPAVAMPGLGLLVATTAVAMLAFSAVLNRARAACAPARDWRAGHCGKGSLGSEGLGSERTQSR